MTPALAVEDLAIDFRSRRGHVRAVDGAALTAACGEVIGVVGESGSGKSTLGMAIGRLLAPGARRVTGDILIDGRSVFALNDDALRTLRAEELGFVFQDPIGTLDPTRRIGLQIRAALPRRGTDREVEAALSGVGLADAGRVARSYPHELSGGMAQRVSICMALARQPRIVIADEPTAALDASIKSQILDLLVGRCRATGATLVLLSHDLHAIRKYSDRVAVMYGGRLVETGPSNVIFTRPAHPYTVMLLRASIADVPIGGRVEPIPGAPPVLEGRCERCSFAPRCHWSEQRCTAVRPEARFVAGREVVCHRAESVVGVRAQ
jgi:oligopeptide/dipeptide ABC transporter ATP-binding protein